MAPKNNQKSASAPKGLQEASGEPFGWHFGFIWASFWTPRGLIFDLFLRAKTNLGSLAPGSRASALASLALALGSWAVALESWALAQKSWALALRS